MDELCLNYANALYGLLTPKQREDALKALSSVCLDLEGEAAFARLLASYNLTSEEKRGVIDKVYGAKFNDIPHFVSFLKVVCDHHRIQELPKINVCYRTLVHGDLGIKEGIAYSAEKLTKEELAALEGAIEKKIGCKVSLSNIVDHKLLGGAKVAVDGKVFDGTLLAKLKTMHAKLNGGIQG